MNTSDIIAPKELQPPVKSRNPFQPKMAPNERYVTEITCDSMCRCPHMDAYLPKYLDTGNINRVNVKNQNGKKRMKRLTISDLHLQSIFPLPSDKDLLESDLKRNTGFVSVGNSSRIGNTSLNTMEEKLNKALGGGFGSCVEIFPPTLLQQTDQERSFESSVKLEQDEIMTHDTSTGQNENDNDEKKKAPLQIESGSVMSNQNLNTSVSTSSSNVSSKPQNVTKRAIEECNTVDLHTWNQMRKDRRQDIEEAEKRVQTWLENTRQNRLDSYNGTEKTCSFCKTKKETKQVPIKSSSSKGDGLMQCLDCGVVACGSDYLLHDGHSRRHMQQHFLLSGHNFAITCGSKGEIFCMKCGDFIYAEVLQEEKSRIDIGQKIPFYKWERYHKLHRGFSFMENGKDFVVVSDKDTRGDKNSAKDNSNGTTVWRGFQATYDFGVPHEFIEAGKMTLRRLDLLQGTSLNAFTTHHAADIMLIQSKRGKDYWKIDSPVGIYNAGNICYISSVIQCIVNLRPVQQFFLKDAKHDCKSCELFRSQKSMNLRGSNLKDSCLACELDRFILKYYGSTQGLDMSPFISELELPVKPIVKTSLDTEEKQREKGIPMDISDLLFTSWKKKEMSTFACDDQHDCHEFMQVFLDTIDKDCKEYQDSIFAARSASISKIITNVADDNENNFRQNLPGSISSLFSGSFRSVLMCKNCGYKRTSLEPFLNVSLSLPLKSRQKIDIITCKYIVT